MNKLNNICNQFQLEGTILTVKPLGEGFINDTLLITTAYNGKTKTFFRISPP